MNDLQQWVRWLTFLYTAGGLLLVAKLWSHALHRRYPYFTAFLAVDTLRTAAILCVPYHTTLYAWFYFIPEPVVAVLYYLLVIEIYHAILSDYVGLAAVSGLALKVILPLTILVSWLVLSPGRPAPGHAYPILQSFLIFQRTIILTAFILLVLLELFLLWYPLTLSRNTIRLCAGYLVLFATQTIGLVSVSLLGFRFTRLANVIIQAVSCGCLLFWLFSLKATGEALESLGARWNPDERERVRQHLDAVNSALFRLVRVRR